MGNKLFVGNISWDSTEQSLREFFEQIGEVVEAKLIIDRVRNRHKGFGFVTYSSEEDAKKAKEELDGKDMDGRPVRIDFAKPKEDDGRRSSAPMAANDDYSDMPEAA